MMKRPQSTLKEIIDDIDLETVYIAHPYVVTPVFGLDKDGNQLLCVPMQLKRIIAPTIRKMNKAMAYDMKHRTADVLKEVYRLIRRQRTTALRKGESTIALLALENHLKNRFKI